ncbi:urease accessory protein UreD [Flexivirga sp. ID2601S]|uniref:Urease accessory protein UreD n=1 Tax=Flexivirga aerilata TaxID=1656889 RepID=A0A849AGC8_9MICO|nr:urease accessory protein UreD [Flexivirga aerilata]NNG38943.1 urease accessory protein UreD [Flexivirga aerilata]
MQTTTITATADGAGGCRLVLRSGLLAPRVVRRSGTAVEVALLATTATLLGGDHARVDIRVGSGCRVTIVDVAATVAYDAGGQKSFWDNLIHVEDGGALCWLAEPLVVADGAHVQRATSAAVASGARLVLREALMLGRHQGVGGVLDARTRIDYDGRPAVVEDLVLTPQSRRQRPLIGDHRFVDTVTAVGFRPVSEGPAPTYRLAVPGAQSRRLSSAAHASDIPRIARDWAGQALSPES